MMECKHKFRHSWDGLSGIEKTEGIPTIYSKNALSTYSQIIFCENCGVVAFNANSNNNPWQETIPAPTKTNLGEVDNGQTKYYG